MRVFAIVTCMDNHAEIMDEGANKTVAVAIGSFFFTILDPSFLDLSPLIVIYHLINATAAVLLHQGGKRIAVLFVGQISI